MGGCYNTREVLTWTRRRRPAAVGRALERQRRVRAEADVARQGDVDARSVRVGAGAVRRQGAVRDKRVTADQRHRAVVR